jgi:hypothetical protein
MTKEGKKMEAAGFFSSRKSEYGNILVLAEKKGDMAKELDITISMFSKL